MKAIILSCTLALVSSPALCQGVAESLELSREVVSSQKRSIVAGSLPLSDAQADAFWPLFDELQEKLRAIDGRYDRVIAEYSAEYATVSDAQARSLLDQSLAIDEDRARLMRTWAKRMDGVLPPRLLVRYFQLEHKFHAIVAADLARQIPLVP